MTLTEIRAALTELETRPRQSLGQNFLYDQNLARGIVEQLQGHHDGTILEIGPGLGALTEYLAPLAKRLVLVEKDERMVTWLARKFPMPQVELFHTDALAFDLRTVCGEGPVAIVGNLPYYISTALISHFTDALSPASILVLTLQHEVATRLSAMPGSADYGAMSVCVQRRWQVRFLRKLPPSVFYPAPKVSSAVVSLTPRPVKEILPLDDTAFENLVRRGFSERRKQLKNLLPELRESWPELTSAAGISAEARAENLTLAQWEQLTALTSPSSAQRGDELFDVVDESDAVLGPQPRAYVHVNNLRHRAIHILLTNAKGELFLQKRSPWKDLNPSLWDSSAAGHVDAGETYHEAAHRELQEELGVSAPLKKIGKLESSPATSWEFVEIFTGSHEGPFHLARMEVEAGAFFPLAKIQAWFANRPQDFTPLFRIIFPRFLEPDSGD
ncbi:MAG: 16S rRNA (adenine(1518)-N(6)/adenine(1519)-N(6))-dimethyltransferase RsmA [Terrimicrobiaceae bacterium]